MADYRYDFLGDKFLTYKNVEEPKVELNLPLFDKPLELDWADRITEDGSIIVKPDEKIKELWVFNNPEYNKLLIIEEPQIQQPKTIQSMLYQPSKNLKITLDKNQQSKALQLMNGLINRKVNPVYAAGIVGNLIKESGFNTNAYNPNDLGSQSGGLALWNGTRFDKLKLYALKRGKHWTDLETLLDYLIETIPNDVSSMLSKSISPYDASEAWAYYEKYAGYNRSIETARKFQKKQGWSNEKTQKWIDSNHDERGNFAEQVYKLWLENR